MAAEQAQPDGIDSTPGEAGQRARSAEIRPFIYAAVDLLMAALYAVLLFGVIPSRHGWVQVLSALLVAAPVAMGAAMIVRRSWSYWLGVAACAFLLVLAVLFLVLTLVSAAFLAGVYGAFGRAASMFALVAAALVIELIALLPMFQLKFLMTRAGRRWFGKGPPRRKEASLGDAPQRGLSKGPPRRKEASLGDAPQRGLSKGPA
jgi:hypothetical protein